MTSDPVNRPDVSVIIPTRDRWSFLSAALTSVLDQENVTLEVIVVDDGSTDETPRRLSELKDPRIRVVRLEESEGVTRARNQGIKIACGVWAAFLDDDDLWSPNKLRTQIDAARAEDASFVYSAAALIDVGGQLSGIRAAPDPGALLPGLLASNLIPAGSSNITVRREALQRARGFDEQFRHLADWDLWIRLAQSSRAAKVEQVLVANRLHAGSMGVADTRGFAKELQLVVSKHRCSRDSAHIAVDRVAMNWWIADLHSRGGRRLRAACGFGTGSAIRLSQGDLRGAGRGLRPFIRALCPWLPSAPRIVKNRTPLPDLPWLDRYCSED